MANSRKYAGLLPDLDEDQDLFETPDLTDETSTRPTDSVTEDADEGEEGADSTDDEVSGVTHRRLHADSARSHFGSSKVDARRTDFSDRLDSKRRSYRVSTRRKADGEDAEISDGEDATPKDGLKRKIASLLKEAEELKAEAQRQHDTAQKTEEKPDAETLKQLSTAVSTLETLGPNGVGGSLGAEARLAKQLSEATAPVSTSGPTQNDSITSSTAKDKQPPTYTLAYQPSFSDQHASSLAASFDTRLKDLELALGLSALPLPTQSDRLPAPLLPQLDLLQSQVSALSATGASHLDAMSKRIRQLTDEADRLDTRRKAAKQSYLEMRTAAANAAAAGGGMSGTAFSHSAHGRTTMAAAAPAASPPATLTTAYPLMEDAETEAKVAALYQTLPTIESLAPSLPLVLERLKSLRLLHADAAGAAARLQRVEERDKEIGEEMGLWRGALEKLEGAVAESEAATRRNMGTVEGWVKELERRVGELKTRP